MKFAVNTYTKSCWIACCICGCNDIPLLH
jgi:hypothetical protein